MDFGSINNCMSDQQKLSLSAAIQAKIETMTGYPNFGGTNTTVLFDL